jgi:hypothetical protein
MCSITSTLKQQWIKAGSVLGVLYHPPDRRMVSVRLPYTGIHTIKILKTNHRKRGQYVRSFKMGDH